MPPPPEPPLPIPRPPPRNGEAGPRTAMRHHRSASPHGIAAPLGPRSPARVRCHKPGHRPHQGVQVQADGAHRRSQHPRRKAGRPDGQPRRNLLPVLTGVVSLRPSPAPRRLGASRPLQRMPQPLRGFQRRRSHQIRLPLPATALGARRRAGWHREAAGDHLRRHLSRRRPRHRPGTRDQRRRHKAHPNGPPLPARRLRRARMTSGASSLHPTW